MYEFDADTTVTPVSEGVWAATPTARWNIGPNPNGGYLLALVLAATGRQITHPDPLVASAFYLGRTEPGVAAVLSVETIKAGRSFSSAEVHLAQQGTERLRALVTYGDLSLQAGPTMVTAAPPPLPPVEECVEIDPSQTPWEFSHRFEMRMPAEMAGLFRRPPNGKAAMGGYSRLRDGRDPDVRSLALFADGFPPPILNVVEAQWVPTLELTVHFRGRPAPGWLQMWFQTRFLVGGVLEEDGEIRDSEGNLVALTRQLAVVRGGTTTAGRDS